MRRILGILVCCLSFVSVWADDWDCLRADQPNPARGCKYTVDEGFVSRTFELWGDVRVTDNPFETDITVYVSTFACDMVVTWVDTPRGCGQWHRVDKNEDFSICFVNNRCDASLVIRYGDAAKEYPVGVLPD